MYFIYQMWDLNQEGHHTIKFRGGGDDKREFQ